MKKILVTGAGGSAANNFIDCLRMSEESYYVVGVDANYRHLSLSRCDKCYVVPRCDDTKYIEALNHIIGKECINLIVPQPDAEVKVVSDNRQRILCKTFLGSQCTIDICQNKYETYNRLCNAHIPVPESYLITDRDTLIKSLDSLLEAGYRKCVWLRAIRGAGSRGAIKTYDIKHAEAHIDYFQRERGIGYRDFMLCEYLPGRDFSWMSLWKNGRLVVSQTRERLQYMFGEQSITGTSSSPSFSRTVHSDQINKMCTDAVLSIDGQANGFFCIDIRENDRKVPCITEINPSRTFTTSNFIAKAGCNMPSIMVTIALDGTLPTNSKQYNVVPPDLYWVRIVDTGYKLCTREEIDITERILC